MIRKALLAGIVLFGVVAGCDSPDKDPNAKVDAPGYYNGPMEPRGGGNKEEAAAPTGAKMTPE